MSNTHTLDHLQELQALPLKLKVRLTQQRIREWVSEFGTDGVYVSFSGGKDSTVLLHIVRELYPDIPAVFCDTGLEYPEIRQFVKTWDNVVWLKPKKNFFQVCEEYGFPLISKEVSECVYGARKYLKSVLEQESLDRQTDKQTIPYAWCMADVLGVDRQEDKENPDYQNLLMGNIPSEYAEKIPFTEWNKASRDMQNLMGWRRANTDLHKPFTPEEVGSSESYELLLKSYVENVKNGEKKSFDYETRRILGLNFTCSTDFVDSLTDEDIEKCSVRLKILLGKLRHKEKGKVTKEYSSMYDRSRYKFYLDAPFEISNKCCNVMKKEPMKRYAKETGRVPFTAQMASESKLRTQNWLKHGCNAFQAVKKISNPMSFWTEQDVLLYIYTNHIPIAKVYGDVVKETEVEGQLDFEDLGLFDLGVPVLKTTGCDRTGCVLCGYGAHREKPGEGRFERLRETHPNMYKSLDRATNNGVTMREAIEWTNEHGDLNIRL